jgi:putative ABC transport system ATP-binding protein
MITLRHVSKTVQSGDRPLTILHPLDLTVPDGQFLAIIGPSGSGKTTLLGLMAGLDAPTTGTITVGGTDITALDEDSLATLRGARIGFVFQFFHLVPSLTALENVLVPMELVGRRGARARAQALLDEVGLGARGHHYPSQLSGGEQQRVAIAVALANDPPLVLADEPTGELDSVTADEIFRLFRALNETTGVTIVIVTHDRAIARRVDRVVAMRDGRTSTEIVRHAAFSRGQAERVEEFAVVDRSGRLQLPREHLDALGVGERARVELSGDHIEVRPEQEVDERPRPWRRP